MDELTEEQIADLKQTFSLFDREGDGAIDTKELGTVMRCIGFEPSEEELLKMVKEVDDDGSGDIGFSEFCSLMARFIKDADPFEAIVKAFKVFDPDGDGHITTTELRQVLTGRELDAKSKGQICDALFTDEQVDEMILAADVNGDADIKYEDLIHMMVYK